MSKQTLTTTDIQKLARLSAVEVNEQEAVLLADQFEQTLEHVDNMKEIDTSALVDTIHLSGNLNVWFEDGQKNQRLLTHEQATENANVPIEQGAFVVDKVL